MSQSNALHLTQSRRVRRVLLISRWGKALTLERHGHHLQSSSLKQRLRKQNRVHYSPGSEPGRVRPDPIRVSVREVPSGPQEDYRTQRVEEFQAVWTDIRGVSHVAYYSDSHVELIAWDRIGATSPTQSNVRVPLAINVHNTDILLS